MNTKYKIYIFHPYSKIGGADLSISRLINNLDQEYFEIDFIYLNKQKISNYLNKKNINFINIKSREPYLVYSRSENIYNMINQKNIKSIFLYLIKILLMFFHFYYYLKLIG